jgi:O-antigen/teichoic acid export membrane protein
VTDTRVRFGADRGARAAAGSVENPHTWATRIVAGWRRHRDLLDNAVSLLATTGLTSLLGFFYWTVATRVFSQQAVGYGSASVSAFTLLGTIGMFGLGTLLIGELPRRSADRAGLVSAALLICALGSLVLGLGFAVVAPRVSGHFAVVLGTPGRAALFVAGTVLTGVTMVFDQATIGLLRGGLQLWRNIAFAVAKMLALPAAAIFLHDAFGFGITAAWVAGVALSLVATAVWLRLKGVHVLPRPHWGILRGLGWTAMAHNWLNISLAVPFTVVPVLVTILVSPAANGAYYIASMLSAFLYLVPSHLATVLFAVVAGDPGAIARKLRVALRLSFLIGIPGMIVLGVGAHFLLSLFGPGYASEATVPLVLLAIGYPLSVPKSLYIAVCRASGKITRAAVVLTIFSAVELGAVAAGAVKDGLIGMSFALLAWRFVETVLVTPTVFRAAMGHGRHRRPAAGVSPVMSDPRATPPGRDGSYRQRQMAPDDEHTQDYAPTRRSGSPWWASDDQHHRDVPEVASAGYFSWSALGPTTGPLPIIRSRPPRGVPMPARTDDQDTVSYPRPPRGVPMPARTDEQGAAAQRQPPRYRRPPSRNGPPDGRNWS